jgi:condensin complex subunit 1
MSSLPDFVLADELLAVRDADYAVAGEQPWSSSADCDAVGAALTRLVDALAAAPAAVEEAHTYAQLLSLVKHYALLGGVQRITLLDALASAYTAALEGAAAALPEGTDAYRAWAPVLERLAFALQWLIHVAERAAGTREERAAAPVPKGRRGRGAKAGMPATRPAAAASAASADLSGYDWEGVLPGLLMLLARSLKLSTALLFPAAATRDAFVACALRPALLLQETEAHLRVPAIKAGIFRVVCAAVKGHAQAFAVQASIAQALAYYEHLAEPMAELLALLRAEYDYERLADDVLRDVGAREFGGIDTRSPRAFARFLVRFTELCPRTVLRSISLLMKHLDSEVSLAFFLHVCVCGGRESWSLCTRMWQELLTRVLRQSYPMRNALLEILGHLIKELTSTDDALPGAAAAEVEGLAALDSTHAMGGNAGSADAQRGSAEARKKQVKHFWELLFERFLDVNSYVRVKCVQVCTRLCE